MTKYDGISKDLPTMPTVNNRPNPNNTIPSTSLHHLEICTENGAGMSAKLSKILGLKIWATRQTKSCKQWVLKRDKIIVTVSERRISVNGESIDSQNITNQDKGVIVNLVNETRESGDHDEDWTVFCCRKTQPHPTDSVFNIALRVSDVSETLSRCSPPTKEALDRRPNSCSNINLKESCTSDSNLYGNLEETEESAIVILKPRVSVSDKYGTVHYAIIKSCLGNVVHTLIDDSEYHGPYLPGYELVDDYSSQNKMGQEVTRNPLGLISQNIVSEKDNILRNSSSAIGTENKRRKAIVNKRRRINSIGNKKSITKSNTSSSRVASSDTILSGIDHIALACRTGDYKRTIEWYTRCLNFQRFILNDQETKEDGFVISNELDIGVRLLAMEYWKCREYSMISTNANSPFGQTNQTGPRSKANHQPLQLVIAESLKNVPDQITKFIDAHGGPGIQHIAFSCQDIFKSRKHLANRGLQFLLTPDAYYKDDEIIQRMSDIKMPMNKIQGTGILIDSDENELTLGYDKHDIKYLFQIFTKPIFDSDTFFLELIERHKTNGFGAGNIPALWRAVKSYMDTKTHGS